MDDQVDADQDEANYEQLLRNQLKPVLAAVLVELVRQQPTDAIKFIAEHIRHLRVTNQQTLITVVSCPVCQSLLRNYDRESDLVSRIAQESVLAVSPSWQKVDIVKAWSFLSAKYGQQLRWWHVASALASRTSRQSLEPLLERTEAYSVILFISSTFSDMHDERDYLVRHVVEQLQEACDQNRLDLHIRPIDLRWGVDSRVSFEVCMNQIRLCREQNVMPYFLCLIGDRYGYVPQDLEEDLRQEFCFIPGMSMTAMEIFAGAIWLANPNALFLIRDSQVLDKIYKLADYEEASKLMQAYRSQDSEGQQSLINLKSLVRKFMKGQVVDYVCNVQDNLEEYGQEKKLILKDFACKDGTPFAKRIVDFFLDRLLQQYPPAVAIDAPPSLLSLQKKQHKQFVRFHESYRTGRKWEIARMIGYIESVREENDAVPVLVLTGPLGVGKLR